jgi:hypothetical protein
MGLTIHYDLQYKGDCPEKARRLVELLRQAALDIALSEVGDVDEFSGIEANFHKAPNDSLRWLMIQSRRLVQIGEEYHLVEPTHVFAFSTWPGEGCEAANFGLALYPDAIECKSRKLGTELNGWLWHSFCKTQYSSNPDAGGMANFVRCHVTVVRLLDRAKEIGILEAVKDEGHYWENRDVKALVETVGKWNRQIAGLVGQYKDLLGSDIDAPITEYPNFEHLEAEGRDERENE